MRLGNRGNNIHIPHLVKANFRNNQSCLFAITQTVSKGNEWEWKQEFALSSLWVMHSTTVVLDEHRKSLKEKSDYRELRIKIASGPMRWNYKFKHWLPLCTALIAVIKFIIIIITYPAHTKNLRKVYNLKHINHTIIILMFMIENNHLVIKATWSKIKNQPPTAPTNTLFPNLLISVPALPSPHLINWRVISKPPFRCSPGRPSNWPVQRGPVNYWDLNNHPPPPPDLSTVAQGHFMVSCISPRQ